MLRVSVLYPGGDGPATGDVMADVAKYTNVAPVMQISEIV